MSFKGLRTIFNKLVTLAYYKHLQLQSTYANLLVKSSCTYKSSKHVNSMAIGV